MDIAVSFALEKYVIKYLVHQNILIQLLSLNY